MTQLGTPSERLLFGVTSCSISISVRKQLDIWHSDTRLSNSANTSIVLLNGTWRWDTR